MRHITYPLLLLFLWFPFDMAFAQNVPDSGLMAEMEDSVSSLSIKPVEHPEELLLRALERLEKDVRQRHGRREYLLEALLMDRMPSPLFVSRPYCVEGDNGIDVLGSDHAVPGPWQFKGEYAQFADTAEVAWLMDWDIMMHLDVKRNKWKQVDLSHLFAYYHSVDMVFSGIMKVYDVTAYSIGDESERGVYRIHFDEKKSLSKVRGSQFENRKMKWYLDASSLRLTQVSEDRYADALQQRSIYRCDFGEESGSPVLTRFVSARIVGGQVTRRTWLRLRGEPTRRG